MEKLFHLKENGTNVKTEVMAGITTFLAMAYILAVNPSMLGDAGMNSQGVFMATALAAAVATIVCRRFKQPLVLGYVVAGFLVSPAIGWIPNIVETADVSTWSQIGVIFLMFGLGLQFSVVKLTTVGRPALVTASWRCRS